MPLCLQMSQFSANSIPTMEPIQAFIAFFFLPVLFLRPHTLWLQGKEREDKGQHAQAEECLCAPDVFSVRIQYHRGNLRNTNGISPSFSPSAVST